MINLREKIIPVLDLRKSFLLPASAPTDETRIIIVEALEKTVGVIVYAVAEVVRLTSASIEPPPPDFMFRNDYVSGIGKLGSRLLIVLNMDNVLSHQEISALP